MKQQTTDSGFSLRGALKYFLRGNLVDMSLPSLVFFVIPVINCWLIALFNWRLALLQIFSILLLLYVMRNTSRQQKKLAMDLEVTEARLQNVTTTSNSIFLSAVPMLVLQLTNGAAICLGVWFIHP